MEASLATEAVYKYSESSANGGRKSRKIMKKSEGFQPYYLVFACDGQGDIKNRLFRSTQI